jgi:all-trans-retinol dehydrogenase (NAD+)
MFDGVKTRVPFLLPILDQKKVTARIIKAIRKDRSRLFMPWIVYTVPLLRILPVGWFDRISTLLGVNSTMDEFTGRQR